jgi:hypothetical protein
VQESEIEWVVEDGPGPENGNALISKEININL